MRTHLWYGLLLVLLVGASGCGGGPEAIKKDQIWVTREITVILEGIKDDASADAAIAKLDKAADRLAELNKRFSEQSLSKEEGLKLMEYAQETADTQKKMDAAQTKALAAAPGKSKQIAAAMAKTTPKFNIGK